MPPKRTIQGSESPKKRTKTTDASQTNIETFFRQGTSSQKGEGAGLSHLSPKLRSNDSKRTTRVSEIIVIDDDEEVSDASRELSNPRARARSAAVSDKRSADEIEIDRQHSVITPIAQEFESQFSGYRQPRHEVTHHASDGTDIASLYSGLPLTPSGPMTRSGPNQTLSITNTNVNSLLARDLDLDEKRGEAQKPAVLSYASPSQNKTTINRTVRSIETEHGTSKSLLDGTVHQSLQPFPDLQTNPIVFDSCPDVVPCPWWAGKNDAPYALLVHALQALTSTRSRIAILSILTNVLRLLIVHDPESVLPALYLLSNSLSPPWQGIELGIGGSIISKALKNTTSITSTAMSTLYKKYGDPGDVAYHAVVGEDGRARTSVLKPHKPLLIKTLYQDLRRIANAKGEGSQKTRQAITEKLILSAVGSWWSGGKKDREANPNKHLIGEEPRYLVRTLAQNLRVGAVRTTILSALARAVVLSPPRNPVVSIPAESEEFTLEEEDIVLVRSAHESVKQEETASISTSPRKAKQRKSESLQDAEKRIQATLKHADGFLRKVFAQHPSFDDIVPVLMEKGIGGIATSVKLTLGVPLLPTLGSPMRALDDIYERLGPNAQWTAEMKYDGQRAQVHAWRKNGTVDIKIFSRHLEDMTDKYPDLIQLLIGIFNSDPSLNSFIVDAEVVAIDPQTGELRSFQELAGRARRDVQLGNIKVMVCLFLFDIMLLNEEILIRYPFRERRRLLRTHLPPVKSQVNKAEDILQTYLQASLDHVDSMESEEGREAIEEFWEKAVESKCEGLMIKLLDDTEVIARDEDDLNDGSDDLQIDSKGLKGVTAPKTRRKALPATYEPDKRTAAWLKLKKDYVTGVGDSLDLVPIGAWHGNGRKANWWSPILLAVYDHQRGIFIALCKCMSGFTDAFYKDLNNRYQVGSDVCSKSSLWEVETGGYQPSVYFKPSEVWEIRGADLTISPTSVTALGMVPHDQAREKGLSLRFPRFIRRREDKTIEMASTPEFVVQLWLSQENKGSTSKLNSNPYGDDELIDHVEEEEIVEEEDSDASSGNENKE